MLIKLGLNPKGGGNYRIMYRRIKELNINISHLTGMASNKGKTLLNRRKPIEDYLNNKIPILSYSLKIKLINSGILKYECSICKLSTWNDLPIPIELDHIDGNNQNNNLENLRILCPNCHAQTPTYCGKNKKSAKKNISNKKKRKHGPVRPKKSKPSCIKCGKILLNIPKYGCCIKCVDRSKFIIREFKPKIKWKPIEELLELLKLHGYSKLGRMLGVSDNAIRKHIKKFI